MKIVVLAGGTSTERSVSITSGTMVCKALREKNHQAVLVDVFCGIDVKGNLEDVFAEEAYDIDKAAEYMHSFDAGLNEMIESRRRFFGPNVLELCQAADIVFMGLHGSNGEDGKVQATFDLLGIRYTGTGYLSSALAMDKGLTKKIFLMDEVPTPKGVSMLKENCTRDIHDLGMEFPVVVKTCCGGSSVGVYIVNDQKEYEEAHTDACQYGADIVVEEYIKGRELSPHQGRDDTSQEIGIFKVSQKSQVDTQTQGDQPFAFPISFGAVHQLRQQKVANRDQSQQKKVCTTTLIIEIIREKRYKQDTGCILTLQQCIYYHKGSKQKEEDTTTEYHRCLRIVGKHIF